MSLPDAKYKLNKPVPYILHVSDELLETTKQELQLARYLTELTDFSEDDWSHGSKVTEVQRPAEFWHDHYDWRSEDARSTEISTGIKSSSNQADAIPLSFFSGWPGSFLEARKLIQPLTDPQDEKAQGFHLVTASIPGFGPGDPPTNSGFGPATVARAFKQVMVDVLGYDHFVTQGGDVGASITRLVALQYLEHVRACHHNFVPVRPPSVYKAPLIVGRFLLRGYLYTAAEQANIKQMLEWQMNEGAYGAIQRTKPQSLGFGLGDSPVGLLAWFLEKFYGWADVVNYKTPDAEVINLVMIHWMQGATPGLRMYKASVQEDIGGKNSRNNAWTSYLGQPWGVSFFPKELAKPPLDWARAVGNL